MQLRDKVAKGVGDLTLHAERVRPVKLVLINAGCRTVARASVIAQVVHRSEGDAPRKYLLSSAVLLMHWMAEFIKHVLPLRSELACQHVRSKTEREPNHQARTDSTSPSGHSCRGRSAQRRLLLTASASR